MDSKRRANLKTTVMLSSYGPESLIRQPFDCVGRLPADSETVYIAFIVSQIATGFDTMSFAQTVSFGFPLYFDVLPLSTNGRLFRFLLELSTNELGRCNGKALWLINCSESHSHVPLSILFPSPSSSLSLPIGLYLRIIVPSWSRLFVDNRSVSSSRFFH